MKTAAPDTVSIPVPHLQQTLFEHYRRLSPASRQLRFMGSFDEAALQRQAITSSPRLALGIDCDGAPRAVVELYLVDQTHAKIGLSVEDAYQGRGYGRALFLRGLREARARNIEKVEVNFRNGNLAIRKLCIEEGGTVCCRGPDFMLHLSLKQKKSDCTPEFPAQHLSV
ncbi:MULTISPECIES: GNAT family N-acetyltransferase [unclassified Sulfitobacter]|uniref:GNAT family N-acetyltransferase n=1 Tax=unclassified Sulfitobacter TaxID=196795 RepID=UPI00374588B2